MTTEVKSQALLGTTGSNLSVMEVDDCKQQQDL